MPAKRTYKLGGNEIARLNLETARRFQRSLSEEGQEDMEYDNDEQLVPDHESETTKRVRHE